MSNNNFIPLSNDDVDKLCKNTADMIEHLSANPHRIDNFIDSQKAALLSYSGDYRYPYIKANDPFASYNVLCSIAEQKQYCILDICVLGSKPMALGACIFALKHQNIAKVSYPFAIEPQKHSSKEISKTWWYTFDI